MRDLNEMFIDLSNLVFEQGEMIDNIETNINITDDYVIQSKTATEAAIDLKAAAKRVRKLADLNN